MNVFKYNKLFSEYCWMGAQDFPSLDVEVFGEDASHIPEALDFELCMEDWWPSFIAEDVL